MNTIRRRMLTGFVAGQVVCAAAADALAERIRCSSRDYRYAFCSTPGRVVSARVVRRHSKRPCNQNFSWGWQRDGIWVDDGCDAEFDVIMRGPAGPGPGGSYPGPGPGYPGPGPYPGPPSSANPSPWAIGEWRGGGYTFSVFRGGSVVLSRGGSYERGYMDGDNITLRDGTRLDADRERNGIQLTWPNGRRLFLRRHRDYDYRD